MHFWDTFFLVPLKDFQLPELTLLGLQHNLSSKLGYWSPPEVSAITGERNQKLNTQKQMWALNLSRAGKQSNSRCHSFSPQELKTQKPKKKNKNKKT